jgi:DNA-binding transcriptional regulator YhcF (GntR family)
MRKLVDGVNAMFLSNDSTKPIYIQIAEQIEDEILTKVLTEGSQVYSTNQISSLYHINPATAGKGINLLVDEGILYKKRGLGMFVADGAVKLIQKKRKQSFYNDYLITTLTEAAKLGITKDDLVNMIKSYDENYDMEE